jgi:hypothetical protein
MKKIMACLFCLVAAIGGLRATDFGEFDKTKSREYNVGDTVTFRAHNYSCVKFVPKSKVEYPSIDPEHWNDVTAAPTLHGLAVGTFDGAPTEIDTATPLNTLVAAINNSSVTWTVTSGTATVNELAPHTSKLFIYKGQTDPINLITAPLP